MGLRKLVISRWVACRPRTMQPTGGTTHRHKGCPFLRRAKGVRGFTRSDLLKSRHGRLPDAPDVHFHDCVWCERHWRGLVAELGRAVAEVTVEDEDG